MNNRLWLSAGVALLHILAHAQDTSKHISFAAPASRASVLLPELSKQFGFPLLTVAQTENEVLLIQVHDVSIKDLMDRIAECANAQWKKEGSAYRLVRPASLSNKAEAKETAHRVEVIQRYLSSLNEAAQATPEWTADEARQLAQAMKTAVENSDRDHMSSKEFRTASRFVRSHAPTGAAFRLLVNQIGAHDLAQIHQGERVVYAMHPTAMQVAMGGDSAKIIERLLEQQQQFAQAYADLGPITRGPIRIQDLTPPTVRTGNSASEVGQAILVLTPSPVTQEIASEVISFQAELIVANAAGETILSSSESLYKQLSDENFEVQSAGSDPITLSPIAREFSSIAKIQPFFPSSDERPSMFSQIGGLSLRFMTKAQSGTPPRPISDELKSRMNQPETYDPLSLLVGEAFTSAATALHQNLVADLPDTCVVPLCRIFQLPNTAIGSNDLLKIYAPRIGLTAVQAGAWITVEPRKPIDAELHRVDRPALGKLLRSFEHQKTVLLEDLASFALHQAKAVEDSDLDGLYLITAGGSLGRSALSTLHNTDIVRIYGTLTSAERSAMESNGAISLEMLTNDQKRWLGDDVFSSLDGPQIREVGPANAAFGRPGQGRQFGPAAASIKEERTQFLPDGIRPDGKLAFQYATTAGLQGQSTQGSFTTFLSLADIATRMFQKERPELGTPIEKVA